MDSKVQEEDAAQLKFPKGKLLCLIFNSICNSFI